MADIPKQIEEKKQFFLKLFEHYSLKNDGCEETNVCCTAMGSMRAPR